MNDDPSPSPATAARGPRPQAGADDAPAVAPPAEEPSNGNEDDSPEARLRRRTVIQTRKKSEFIHDITVNLDMLIYAELSFMYSLEYVLLSPPSCPLSKKPFLTFPPAVPSSASSSAQSSNSPSSPPTRQPHLSPAIARMSSRFSAPTPFASSYTSSLPCRLPANSHAGISMAG